MDNTTISTREKRGMSTRSAARFLGVRQRPSGRWVAEIKVSSQKLRLWLGTYDRPEEAAKAYDYAARLLRGMNAKTNFPPVNENMQVPLRSPRLHQLMHHEELSSCVHDTVVCSPVSSGRSRVYSSVVVAPSFGDGLCQGEEGKQG